MRVTGEKGVSVTVGVRVTVIVNVSVGVWDGPGVADRMIGDEVTVIVPGTEETDAVAVSVAASGLGASCTAMNPRQ